MDVLLPSACAKQVSDETQKDVLDSLEMLSALYDYNHHTYAQIRPFLSGSVCEIGSGMGNVIQFLLNHERVVGIEPFPQSIEKARRRFADHRNVSFVNTWLSDCPNEKVPAGSFDSVICLRTLECMENDQDALRRMHDLCIPGGSVVIVVAAHRSAYGTLDENYGHLRRYSRRGLANLFSCAGLTVTKSFYTNAPGYLGWLWHSRILRKRKIPTSAAGLSDRLAPFIDAFERIVHPPFGQSLVMIGARKHIVTTNT